MIEKLFWFYSYKFSQAIVNVNDGNWGHTYLYTFVWYMCFNI